MLARLHPIQDCPAGTFVRLDGHRADVMTNGEIVSTPEAMKGWAVLGALGGQVPVWVHTLLAVREFLADVAVHAPHVPARDIEDAIFHLTRDLTWRRRRGPRVGVVEQTPRADWTWIAAAYDPDDRARSGAARYLLPHIDHEARALAKLAGEPFDVAHELVDRPAVRAHPEIMARLSQNPDPSIQDFLRPR